MKRCLFVIMLALGAAAPATAATLPAGGPRDVYERSLGDPPRVYQPPGALGHDWSGTPPYIANAVAYSRGELIADDTPFDDTGADTTPGNGDAFGQAVAAGTLPGVCQPGEYWTPSPAQYGDHVYPSEGTRGTADLVEARVAADEDAYYFAFVLQTMTAADQAVVGLGLTANGEAPGAGSGLAAFHHLVQIAPNGATVDGAGVPSRIDVAGHVLEARVPRAMLPGGRWQAAAAAGVWNGSGWDGVTDLAHVPDEPLVGVPNCWFERRQAQLIAAGTFPTTTIDPARLGGDYSSRADEPSGPMIRLFYPRINLGEGIVGQTRYAQDALAFVYRGLLQPYAFYASPRYDEAADNPLLMLLHCLNCTHDVYFSSSWPGMQKLADDRGGVIAMPLAYGEGGHYEGEAEWDVFDVLADVSARYRIDRDRLYLAGMSMGSLGTYRLGLLYPDLWARTFGVGNYTTPFCATPSPSVSSQAGSCGGPGAENYYDILENGRNIAWGLVNGATDELSPITGAQEIANRLDALGYPEHLWIFPSRQHDPSLTGQTSDLTSAWLGTARRIEHPAHVTYKVMANMDDQTWHLRHDRAYWVSGIRLAKGASSGLVDAASGRGQLYRRKAASENGSDAAGPYTGSGQDPVEATVDGGNRLELSLHAISALRVDVAGALLCPGRPVNVKVTSDAPATVDLAGLQKLDVPAGTRTWTLSDESLNGSCTRTESAAPPVATPSAAAQAVGAHRCTSRRSFVIRLRRPRHRGERLVRARVTVDGRHVRVFRRRGRLAARIDLRGRPLTTVRVRVIARTSRGRIVRETRSYRLCARGRSPGGPLSR